MPLGTYVIDNASGGTTYFGSNYTICTVGSYSTQIKLRSILVRFYTTGTFNGRAVVYSFAGGALLGSSAIQNMSITSTTQLYEIPLTTPLIINANYDVKVGLWGGSGGAYPAVTSVASDVFNSSPAFATWNGYNYLKYASSNTNPNSDYNIGSVVAGGVSFDSPNQAPVISNLQIEILQSGGVYTGANATWSYSDAEGNAATASEFGFRIKDSGSTWTTEVDSPYPTEYYMANPGTGAEYEVRFRTQDSAGQWSGYLYGEYTAAIGQWKYTPEVTSAVTSGQIPHNFIKSGTFENSTDTAEWDSNNLFNTYATATFSRSTTRAHSGTYSLKVDYPTDATKPSRVNARPSFLLGTPEVGKKYVLEAWVYAEPGAPDIKLDAFTQDEMEVEPITTKGAWVHSSITFVANSSTIYLAVPTINASTAGTVYIDDVKMYEYLEPGTYETQVRTADAVGFGPWSTSDTFTIAPANLPPVVSNLVVPATAYGSDSNLTWTYTDPESDPQVSYQIRTRGPAVDSYAAIVESYSTEIYHRLNDPDKTSEDAFIGPNGTYSASAVVGVADSPAPNQTSMSNGYLTIPNWTKPQALTINCWFRCMPGELDNTTSYRSAWGFGTNDWDARFDTKRHVTFHAYGVSGGWAGWGLDTTFDMDDGNWHMLTFVWDGITGFWNTFLDGVENNSGTFAPEMPRAHAGTFTIGAAAGARVWVGDMADFSIHDYALSVGEVEGLWDTMGFTTTDPWWERVAVNSSTHGGPLSTAGLTYPRDYEVQVRAKDATQWGLWTPSTTFTVGPPTNIKTRIGGTFVDGIHMTRQNGIWVQVPPTQTKAGGTF